MTHRKLIAAVILPLVLGLPGIASADLSQKVNFNIARQSLQEALIKYSAMTGVQVTSPSGIVSGKQSTGVSGTLAARDALQRLLDGTGLTYDVVNDTTVVIRASTATTEPAPGRSPAKSETHSGTSSEQAAPESEEPGRQSVVRGIPEIVVSGSKLLNVDVVRSVDDPQAYFVIDSKRIAASGATSVEEFLKNNLSMNTTAQTNSQTSPNFVGTLGSVNLRGVGSGQTLILINGRRVAGAGLILSVNYPPDINSIPPAAIERIEVLPSSSTGIYGGTAVGGVINIILKQDFNGGNISARYGNSFDGVARNRDFDGVYGTSFEDGRTNVLFAAHLSDSEMPTVGDRQELWARGLRRAYANSPSYVAQSTAPYYVGSTTNIASATGALLTLKPGYGGYSLGSTTTHVATGTSASTDPTQLGLGLLANAGSYDLTAPPTAQQISGRLNQVGTGPTTETFLGTVRRQMTDWLELFTELSSTSNRATDPTVPVSVYQVPASAPTNPFNQAVLVSFPTTFAADFETRNITHRITAGFIGHLPGNWLVQGDYVWSQNELSYRGSILPSAGQAGSLATALATGTLNPFVDTLEWPLAIAASAGTYGRDSTAVMRNTALRFAGPVYTLPAGPLITTIGLEHRQENLEAGLYQVIYPNYPQSSSTTPDPPEGQRTDSVYVEAEIPLISAQQQVPFVRDLRFQAAGRYENYKVDVTSFPTVSTGVPQTSSQTRFSATKPMLALSYRPLDSVMLRGSYSTSFLPPPYSSLVPAYLAFGNMATVSDPKRGGAVTTGIPYLIGGDPNISPQQSKDWSLGLVFEPEFAPGLRASLDWYWLNLTQVAISPTPQQVVDLENQFPGRVTRAAAAAGDPYGVGAITQIDTSTIAAAKARTTGVSATLGYQLVTSSAGRFNFSAGGTRIGSFERQLTLGGAMQDMLNEVAFGGPLKWRGNAAAQWNMGGWNASWMVSYFGSYRQYDIGGTQRYIQAQGGRMVPSQAYHDLTAGYDFESRTSVRLGIKNVFNSLPPFDAYYSTNGFYSPFGDARLRSFWLQLSQAF